MQSSTCTASSPWRPSHGTGRTRRKASWTSSARGQMAPSWQTLETRIRCYACFERTNSRAEITRYCCSPLQPLRIICTSCTANPAPESEAVAMLTEPTKQARHSTAHGLAWGRRPDVSRSCCVGLLHTARMDNPKSQLGIPLVVKPY